MIEMYRSFHRAMSKRFGCKVYRLALDGGMTCPNRDGSIGEKGCIFCGDMGAGDFAEPHCQDMKYQITQAKKRVKEKLKDGKYVSYFQSFTNTYAPISYLEKIFQEAMEPSDVVALSIATRPDCLSAEIIALLQKLQRKKPVWIELGLQAMHPHTADWIRRGYALSVFDDAVSRLREAGFDMIVHMILGLPGEDREMMVETARYIGRSGAAGIKLQLLHVMEGTDLAEEYRKGTFETLSLECYTAIVEACIRVLPPDMVIHRLTGDGAKARLIAPLWSANKKKVLNYMQHQFRANRLQQGSLWTGKDV